MDYMFLEGFSVEASIGVHAWEKVRKQPLVFDVKIPTDCSAAAKQDQLDTVLDYTQILDFIRKQACEQHYQLLESLAAKVADELMREFQLPGLTLTVRKLKTLTGLNAVGVTLSRGEAAGQKSEA